MNNYEQNYARGWENPRTISDGQQTRCREETSPVEIIERSHASSAPSLSSLFIEGIALLLMVCCVSAWLA
jgi:hypothetical protein